MQPTTKATAERSKPIITDRHHGAISVAAAMAAASIAKNSRKRGGAMRVRIAFMRAIPAQPRAVELFPQSTIWSGCDSSVFGDIRILPRAIMGNESFPPIPALAVDVGSGGWHT